MTTTTAAPSTNGVLGRPDVAPDRDRPLDTWPAPPGDVVVSITGDRGELTAVCPKTTQPDAYAYAIRYRPAGRVVEGKSLKLFLASFRNTGVGAEDLAAEIRDKLVAALDPAALTVDLHQNPRGGMVIHASARYNGGVLA